MSASGSAQGQLIISGSRPLSQTRRRRDSQMKAVRLFWERSKLALVAEFELTPDPNARAALPSMNRRTALRTTQNPRLEIPPRSTRLESEWIDLTAPCAEGTPAASSDTELKESRSLSVRPLMEQSQVEPSVQLRRVMQHPLHPAYYADYCSGEDGRLLPAAHTSPVQMPSSNLAAQDDRARIFLAEGF